MSRMQLQRKPMNNKTKQNKTPQRPLRNPRGYSEQGLKPAGIIPRKKRVKHQWLKGYVRQIFFQHSNLTIIQYQYYITQE